MWKRASRGTSFHTLGEEYEENEEVVATPHRNGPGQDKEDEDVTTLTQQWSRAGDNR